jgi:hypothetical protein
MGRTLAVPRPRSPWSGENESAGNLALTDPAGCSADVLRATGKLATAIGLRRPVADAVLESADDIVSLLKAQGS